MALDPNRPFHISPPFGSYFGGSNAYQHLGSFTVNRRPGRTYRVLKTVRPVPSDEGGAWINKIGLRNAGIGSLQMSGMSYRVRRAHVIVSLAALENGDWAAFERSLDMLLGPIQVEFNPSCPNTDERADLPTMRQLRRLLVQVPNAIFKLPPQRTSVDDAAFLFDQGVRYVHLSNTIPSPIGGISGWPLMQVNLPLVEEVANMLPQLEIIGGGGIYTYDDVERYRSAGARRFSIGSAFFWPPRGWRILREAKTRTA